MDIGGNLTSRFNRKYLKSTLSEDHDERRYLLSSDDLEQMIDAELNQPLSKYFKDCKAKEEDIIDPLISVPGRPPTRPPTDQCVEAEIQAGDTLASTALKYNVPVAELKRVNRLLNEKDFHAKKSVKIPVKPASLLTETLPVVENRRSSASLLEVGNDTPLRGSSKSPTETPEVRRALRLLHKIDDDVRNISQKQDDLKTSFSSPDLTSTGLLTHLEKTDNKDSCLDRLNSNGKWICFYAVLFIVAVGLILALIRYETNLLSHTSHEERNLAH